VERTRTIESYTVMLLAVQKYGILTNYKINCKRNRYTLRDITRRLVENYYQFQINKDIISTYGIKEAEKICIYYTKIGKVGLFYVILILFSMAQQLLVYQDLLIFEVSR
jgi:carbon starvation protein CstA